MGEGAVIYLGDDCGGFGSDGFHGTYLVFDGIAVYRVLVPEGIDEPVGCECSPSEDAWLRSPDPCAHWLAANETRVWLATRQKYRLADANFFDAALEHLESALQMVATTRTVPEVREEARGKLEYVIALLRRERGLVLADVARDPRYRGRGND